MKSMPVIDWRSAAVFGGTIIGLSLIIKLEPSDIKEVLMHAIDTLKRSPNPAISDG